jgi:hypothetical protein
VNPQVSRKPPAAQDLRQPAAQQQKKKLSRVGHLKLRVQQTVRVQQAVRMQQQQQHPQQ